MKLMSNFAAEGGTAHLKIFKSLLFTGYFLLLQVLGGFLVAGNAILRGKREEEGGGGGGAETSASGLPRYKTLSKNCYPKNMPFFLFLSILNKSKDDDDMDAAIYTVWWFWVLCVVVFCCAFVCFPLLICFCCGCGIAAAGRSASSGSSHKRKK